MRPSAAAPRHDHGLVVLLLHDDDSGLAARERRRLVTTLDSPRHADDEIHTSVRARHGVVREAVGIVQGPSRVDLLVADAASLRPETPDRSSNDRLTTPRVHRFQADPDVVLADTVGPLDRFARQRVVRPVDAERSPPLETVSDLFFRPASQGLLSPFLRLLAQV